MSQANRQPERLRVGIVGAGIGAGYAAAFQQVEAVDVAAICARSSARAAPLAQKYHIPAVYTDYEAMLAQEPLDIVVVATPNNLHYPMTLTALEAGKHVICDKPLAMNAEQAHALAARANALRRRHFVPFVWRFLPAAAYMKELIDAGAVGETYHVYVRYFNLGWGDAQGPMRWQYDRAQAGSGALGNLGSHAIHLIHWWLGGIHRVCAHLTTVVKTRALPEGGQSPVTVDDHCAFLGELDGGVPLVFSASSVAHVARVNVEIGVFGGDGSLVFRDDWAMDDAWIGRIDAMRKGDSVPTRVPIPARLTGEFRHMPDYTTPMRGCFARMAAEFAGAIREDRAASPNFHDGAQVQAVMDAVLQSAAEARWVTI